MPRACQEPQATLALLDTLADGGSLDGVIAELAGRQHGVVSAAQLRSLGLSGSAVTARARAGRLHRLHRGVYAVGHSGVSQEGRWLAAVLACAHGAVLSHRSAAALWGLRPPVAAWPEVTVTAGKGGRRRGIRVYRTRVLAEADVAVSEGLPCTSVARTLVDMAATVGEGALAAALDRAETLRLFDAVAVAQALDRAGPRRGTAVLRSLLGDRWEPASTRSELEARFLALCREARLPMPAVDRHVRLGASLRQVDFQWPERRLMVETDGYRDHGGRRAFESDRRRDQQLIAGGWQVVRFTWRQITREPAYVEGILRRLLGAHAERANKRERC